MLLGRKPQSVDEDVRIRSDACHGAEPEMLKLRKEPKIQSWSVGDGTVDVQNVSVVSSLLTGDRYKSLLNNVFAQIALC